MKIDIDDEAQAAYAELVDAPSARTVEMTASMLVDLDDADVLVGIEFLTLDTAFWDIQRVLEECQVPADQFSALHALAVAVEQGHGRPPVAASSDRRPGRRAVPWCEGRSARR